MTPPESRARFLILSPQLSLAWHFPPHDWVTAAAPTTWGHTPGRRRMGRGGGEEGQRERGPLYCANAPSGLPGTHWPESIHKTNPSCKGVGQRVLLLGALPLRTQVMFSWPRRCGEWVLGQWALSCHCHGVQVAPMCVSPR